MCKGLCKEKCGACFEKGMSCCKNFTPIMTYEEAARVYFECPEIDDMGLTITFTNENTFMYVPKERANGKKQIRIDEIDCPFLNQKDGSCKIYDYRPSICREYGEHEFAPCPFEEITIEELKEADSNTLVELRTKANESQRKRVKDLLKNAPVLFEHKGIMNSKIVKMKKFSKKDLKNMKEDMLLYQAMYHIFNDDAKINNPYFTVKHDYLLGLTERKSITAIRVNKISTDILALKPIAKFYNRVNRIFSYYSLDYLEVLVDKLNRISNGVTIKEVPEDVLPLRKQSVALGAILIREYQTNYKLKSDKFKGLITSNELWEMVKFFVEESGGFEGNNTFLLNEAIRNIMDVGSALHKAIMRQR